MKIIDEKNMSQALTKVAEKIIQGKNEIDNMILIQEEQPTSSDNKLWVVDNDEETVLVPTGEEFNELKDSVDNLEEQMEEVASGDIILIQDEQPASQNNKLWIDSDSDSEVTVPTYTEFSGLKDYVNVLKPSATTGDVGKALIVKRVNDGFVAEYEFGKAGGADSFVTPEMFGAVGDGVKDDSEAVQAAVNAGYDVYFASGKTYYLGNAVEITSDHRLRGGLNSTIKTVTPNGGEVNKGIYAHGLLKYTTTLTSDYTVYSNTENSANQITLDDMSDVNIGDILIIKATDQYYSYSRQYYYLGAVLLVTDKYDGHLYVNTSLPFDITKTENVSVDVYSAPEIHIENLHFVSDHESFESGTYNALVDINFCKNTTIKDCTFTMFVMGIYFRNCVNSLVDNVSLSKSKYDNTLVAHDGYGLAISSCTNTVIRRMISLCSQSCVDLTGQIPNINTYVFESNIASEARALGLGSHENSYNLVVEDCVLAGLSAYGTVTVNRCRFIKNNRVPASNAGINYRGCHNAEWSKLSVSNCVFDGSMSINILAPDSQSPVQAFSNKIKSITINDCEGGAFTYIPSVNSTILENEIDELEIKGWKNCGELYYNPINSINYLKIEDCTFTKTLFLNDHNNAHGIVTDNIEKIEIINLKSVTHKVHVNKTTYGEKVILPENALIEFTASNETDQFMICGRTVVSNDANDYAIGPISGNVGAYLSRGVATGTNIPTMTINENGAIIYSQNNNTAKRYLYNKFMFYVDEITDITVYTKVKNTGATDPTKWRIYVHTVDPTTGYVAGRNNSSLVESTASGADMTLNVNGISNRLVLISFYCDTAIANAETTFENFTVTKSPKFNCEPSVEDEFKAKRLTGSGVLTSYAGINNIMTNVDTFHIKYGTDYILGSAT